MIDAIIFIAAYIAISALIVKVAFLSVSKFSK